MDIDIGTLVSLMVIVISLISWARRSQNPAGEDTEAPPTLRKEDLPEATRRLYEREHEIPVAPPKTSPSPAVSPDSPAAAGPTRPPERPSVPSANSAPRPQSPAPVRRRWTDEDEFERMTEGDVRPRRPRRPLLKPSPRRSVPAGRPESVTRPVHPAPAHSGTSSQTTLTLSRAPVKPAAGPAAAPGMTSLPPSVARPVSSGLSRKLRSAIRQPATRRQAVLYREILGPPPGLRPPGVSRFDYPFL